MSGEATPQPIGPLLDGLDVTASLAPGDLVSGAVVMMTVVAEDGAERVQTAYSESLPWVARVGLTVLAADTERRGARTGEQT